jgi:predicted CXXCH cytochrome family protein
MGQDIAFTKTLDIQVGSVEPTQATLTTGKCNSCHTKGASLGHVLHANPNRATCVGCHAPLGLEYDAPVHARVHYIHSRSNRVDLNPQQCSNCHLSEASIQFTSKAACLSCHVSYPDDHVATFGPVLDVYVGGEEESFARCSDTCHTSHPGSGL